MAIRFFRAAWAAAIGLAVVAGLALAHGRGTWTDDPAKIEKFVNKHVEKLIQEIQATDAQKTKIYAIRDSVLPDILALSKDRKAAKEEFKQAWSKDTFDKAKVQATADRLGDEYRAFGHKILDAMGEFHAILTPEQRDKVAKMWEHEHGGGGKGTEK